MVRHGQGHRNSQKRNVETGSYMCALCRPWKDHFKSDLRSDQDHRLKKDLRSDQDHIFLKSDLDLKSRSKIIFLFQKSPF
jgi:hypothetical protein